MSRRALLGLAALLLAGTALPGHAATPLAVDLCGWASITDPTSVDRQVGEIHGGPMVATAVDPAAGLVLVTLTCSLRTGPYTATHLDPVAASASASGFGIAVLPPTPVAYPAAPDAFVSVCTDVVLADGAGSTHYYWDAWVQEFSTDPSVPCTGAECLSTECGPSGQVDRLLADAVDPVVCPVLAMPFPPDGDNDVWECPPYGSR
jgi:hypothetical protein